MTSAPRLVLASGSPRRREILAALGYEFAVRPADIDEARLARYIEVRASVYSVYEKYRGEIESRVAKMKDHDLWITFFRDKEDNLLALSCDIPHV